MNTPKKSSIILFIALILVISVGYIAITSGDPQTNNEVNLLSDGTSVVHSKYTPGSTFRYISSVSWYVPEGGDINNVNMENGMILYKRIKGNQVFALGITFDKMGTPVYNVNYEAEYDIEQYDALKMANINVPSSHDSVTTIKTPERIITEFSDFEQSHFEFKNSRKAITYETEGGVTTSISYSNGGDDYDNYVGFGDVSLAEADSMYDDLFETNFGFTYQNVRHPVVVVSDERFYSIRGRSNRYVGRFKNGVIFLKRSLLDEGDVTGIVAHETSHHYVQKEMSYLEKKPPLWLDEGIAEYIEGTAYRKQGYRTGINTNLSEECEPGQTCAVDLTVPYEQIREYYDKGYVYDHAWEDTPEDVKRYGYVYSQLVIENYLDKNNQTTFVKEFEMIRNWNETVPVENTQDHILHIFPVDERPCDYQDVDRLKQCVKSLEHS